MLKKVKKSFILFMCTIVLVTSISITVYKPIPVKAAAIAAAPIAETAITFIIELIAAGLVSIGAYELYENKDYFAEVVNEYMTAITDWPSHWGDVEEKHHGETWVKNPNTGEWEGIPSDKPIILTPEQQEGYGWNSPFVYPEDKDAFFKKVYDSKYGNGGGGGGGGNDNEPNNNNKFDLNNLDTDFLAKSSVGVATSVSIFLEKLFSGEVENETLSKVLETYKDDISYNGHYEMVGEKYSVDLYAERSYSNGGYGIWHSIDNVPLLSDYKPVGFYANGNLQVYFITGVGKYQFFSTRFACTTYYSDGTLVAKDLNAGASDIYCHTYHANFPVFDNSVLFENFTKTGDDTGCINKEQKKLFTALDYKAMSSKLPSTLGALSSLPSGKAFNATALKDYVNDMVANKDNITDVETQTNTAKEKLEEHIEQNKTDIKTDTDTEPKPSPLPVPKPDFPTPDDITIEDIDVTRDWRLVFPFCIPFDIIDLFRVLEAEPEAPYFEIPFVYEEIGLDYTFVIDFEQFNSLAEILRLGEVVFFILGLCMLTGKVIKW